MQSLVNPVKETPVPTGPAIGSDGNGAVLAHGHTGILVETTQAAQVVGSVRVLAGPGRAAIGSLQNSPGVARCVTGIGGGTTHAIDNVTLGAVVLPVPGAVARADGPGGRDQGRGDRRRAGVRNAGRQPGVRGQGKDQ